jgi:hypothetical protein
MTGYLTPLSTQTDIVTRVRLSISVQNVTWECYQFPVDVPSTLSRFHTVTPSVGWINNVSRAEEEHHARSHKHSNVTMSFSNPRRNTRCQ